MERREHIIKSVNVGHCITYTSACPWQTRVICTTNLWLQ